MSLSNVVSLSNHPSFDKLRIRQAQDERLSFASCSPLLGLGGFPLIAAVVIASGFSRRMGRSKLTLELGGRTFLQRAVEAATGARGVGRCLVVLRPEDAPLLEQTRTPGSGPPGETHGTPDAPDRAQRIELILNPMAAQGQSASIRLATERLNADPSCEAVIFSVVDQPFMRAEVFDALAAAWQAGQGDIIVATYAGQRGNPVLFARRLFSDLLQLSGDVGGREVIRRYPDDVCEVAMPDPEAGRDVDTLEDYLAMEGSP